MERPAGATTRRRAERPAGATTRRRAERPGGDVFTPRSRSRALVALLVVLAFSGCLGASDGDGGASGHQVMDATGARVDVSDPSRLVVTSVDLAETVALLGHADRLMGVPAWIESKSGCVSVLPGLEEVPRIGRPVVVTAENVLTADPTLVLDRPFPLSPNPLAPTLRPLGVPVYQFDHRESLEQVPETYARVAEILTPVDPEVEARAAQLATDFEADADALAERLAALAERSTGSPHALWATGDRAPRAVYQLPAGLIAAEDTSGGLVLRSAGLLDAATAAGLTGYQQMSSEALATADPERVVASCTAAMDPAGLYDAPKYRSTTAARVGDASFVATDPALSGIVGPRFIEGAKALARQVHPAAFDLLRIDVRVAHDPEANALTITLTNGTRSTDPRLEDSTLTVHLVPRDPSSDDTIRSVTHGAPDGASTTRNGTTIIQTPFDGTTPQPGQHVADLWVVDAAARGELLRILMP